MNRREFIAVVGGAAVAWPLAARAQQLAMPVVGFVSPNTLDELPFIVGAFRKGLNEAGFIAGQNVTVEYASVEGHFDRLPTVMTDLVRRKVTVISTPGTAVTLAAKAATTTIPIVFGVGGDPVRLGLVTSLARPGGNATGINFFDHEVTTKRLRLLHDLVPKAVHIAVLINPANLASAESTLRDVQQVAAAMGLQTKILNASTTAEIDAAFAALARERADALFVASDGFFDNSAMQLAALAARDRIPAAYIPPVIKAIPEG
jgi:putative ABC transport system substrate-binding protein